MKILIKEDTLEVIATIGAKKDIVNNDYKLIDLGETEPRLINKDGKLYLSGISNMII